MAGLSQTHYDSSTILVTASPDGDTATAIAGNPGGRALSDVAHGSSAGLRYFEVEVVQLRSSNNAFTIGIVDNESNLTQWLGGGSESGFLWRFAGSLTRFLNGNLASTHGNSLGNVGMHACFWVDPSSRNVWVTSTDRVGGRYGDLDGNESARPDLGTAPTFTIPGTGDLRVALTPARGDGTDANVLRFRSRYSQLRVRGQELLGAIPWDARVASIVEEVSGIPDGTDLKWAWFDEPTPNLFSMPTSKGVVTKSAGEVSFSINTSLDALGVGSFILSDTNGSIVQCFSHYAPASAP